MTTMTLNRLARARAWLLRHIKQIPFQREIIWRLKLPSPRGEWILTNEEVELIKSDRFWVAIQGNNNGTA